jgi:ATP-dependent Clp protease protease subunit
MNFSKTEPITLMISTYGGSVHEMFGLYDIMKFSPCPIHTVGLGKVMSAGVLLLSAGDRGSRMIGRHARIMMHPMTDTIEGNIFQMTNDMKETIKVHQMMHDAYLKETKLTFKQLDTLMKLGHDSYIAVEDAIKFGIADRIIG